MGDCHSFSTENVTEPNLDPVSGMQKVDLLMPGCGEGKCSVYCKILDQSSGQLMLRKPELPKGFRETFFQSR